MNDTSTNNQSQEKKEVILWEESKNTTPLKKLESPITPNECATTINIKDSKGNEHLIDIIGGLGKHHRNKTGIYLMHCSGNNKIYIGSAVNLYKRMLDHRRMLVNNKHHSAYAQHSYDKYGIDAFRFYVIRECFRFERKDIEDIYIKKYYDFKILLNMVNGARGTDGMVISQERRDKISKSNMGRIPYNKGGKMENDQKELLSKINIMKYGKMVHVYTRQGELIETIDGIRATGRKYNTDKRTIQRILKGKIAYHGNYTFRYLGERFEDGHTYIQTINDNIKSKILIYKSINNGHTMAECERISDKSSNMVSLCAINYISWIYTKSKLNIWSSFRY